MASLSLCPSTNNGNSTISLKENQTFHSKASLPSQCSAPLCSKRSSTKLDSVSRKLKSSFSIATNSPLITPAPSLKRGSTIIKATASALRDQAEANAALAVAGQESDPFVAQIVQNLVANALSKPSPDPILAKLIESSTESALTMRWPTNRDELYRFTSLRPIQNCLIVPVPSSNTSENAIDVDMGRFSLQESNGWRLVLVDGSIDHGLSHLSEGENIERESGIVVGSLSQMSEELKEKYVAPKLGFSNASSSARKDLFCTLNGIGATEVVVIIVPKGVKVKHPIHIVHLATGSGDSAVTRLSSPRLLVVAEEDSEIEIVEEYAGVAGGCYWVNSVAEISVGKNAVVAHSFIQEEARDSFNIRRTYVEQEGESKYSLLEAQLGGQISRHNFQMIQKGSETETEVSTFSLAGHRQLQDLHSSLILDHPRGITNQLHKCIVTDSSGHGVFDGNVKVNRFAQQTDAGQLSRCLLLAPKGTVNVKPNLQIIADDVKCTHGAAISDLEEDQIFYFQARGIDEASARSALVFSFGAEVLGKLRYPDLRHRLEVTVKASLAAEGAMDSSVAAGLGASQ